MIMGLPEITVYSIAVVTGLIIIILILWGLKFESEDGLDG